MRSIGVSVQSLERLLESGVIEFLDLGCSSGGSYQYIRRCTDMRVGLSLDLSRDKITRCRKVNDLSFAFDVLRLPKVPQSVSSAFCIHFLEHVDNAETVFRIIEGALTATRDFVFVRQPYFDHDAELASLGCRTYWSDWSGHKTKLTRDEVKALSRRLEAKGLLGDVTVRGIDRISTTSHDAVLPLNAPPDQHAYVLEEHGPKPEAAIEFDCFREIVIVFERRSITKVGTQRLAQLVDSIGKRATDLAPVGTAHRSVVTV